ncbi:hypothetical protein Nepgr_021905 [Nepenthes gracilis]|uniref:RRM domain-containing protein n=1 Tax=Nepenthes gracilis TaxID=150966 RepID=A0AAD3SZF6_NEPGR|nr:hypothetical protein Nepgr_021905 [Nepenthes gracilis]
MGLQLYLRQSNGCSKSLMLRIFSKTTLENRQMIFLTLQSMTDKKFLLPCLKNLPASHKSIPMLLLHASRSQRNQQATFQQPQQSGTALVANDSLEVEAAEEVSTDLKGEMKSVYVRNLPTTVSSVEVEEEFKKFGRLKPAGVAIRRLKDTDICYAFVEFEDITAVHDAIKAATVKIAGQQIYIEELRANGRFSHGRRGRASSNYQPDASRGHFGSCSFSRG